MKKFFIGLVCGAILASSTIIFASESIQTNIFRTELIFNGETKNPPADKPILKLKDSTYVPLRYFAESMGATVGYYERGGSYDPQIIINYPTASGLLIKDPNESRVSLGNLQLKKRANDGGTYVTAQMKLEESPYSVSAVLFQISFFDENEQFIFLTEGTGQLMKPGEIQTFTFYAGTLEKYSSVKLKIIEIRDMTDTGHDSL